MQQINVKISELKQHAFHKALYSTRKVDELTESIKEKGILQPIVINKKKEVISGWLRVLAFKSLRLKEIPAIIMTTTPPADEICLIIDYNQQRVKTLMERWKEAQELKKYWGKKQGERTDKNTKLSSEELKHTDKRIAKQVGISEGNLHKLKKIAELKPASLNLIETGEYSIHEAFNDCTGKGKKVAKILSQSAPPRKLEKLFTHECPGCGHKF